MIRPMFLMLFGLVLVPDLALANICTCPDAITGDPSATGIVYDIGGPTQKRNGVQAACVGTNGADIITETD